MHSSTVLLNIGYGHRHHNWYTLLVRLGHQWGTKHCVLLTVASAQPLGPIASSCPLFSYRSESIGDRSNAFFQVSITPG